jgi:multidrug efflux pump subunit AcrA (membrane-fusion protein)
VPIYLRGVGTVIAYNNVIVRSQITGQIVKIAFNQGQTVHQGDLLAQIDQRPFQAQLDQAIANRDRDQRSSSTPRPISSGTHHCSKKVTPAGADEFKLHKFNGANRRRSRHSSN